ncbi:MAG TPA: hypothetical protein VHB30_12910 [Solirubrobacteraceae bacterium]|nr:hypothetical protein [Solirubrobacteraceae bacterium]
MSDRRPLLSLVLCSRNDGFQGDSLWRLQTTVNHAARQAALLGRLESIEVIVSDWGSERPLRDAVRLSPDAARVTRFLTVPADLAREKQCDSPFAEVIAINAAARRARGDYIGRIDQDTLVGRRFLRWLFDAARDGATFPLEASVMISNRRRIPYRFAVRTPPFPVVERYVRSFGRILPAMGGGGSRFWEVYVGILLFHRDLWEQCAGYDESLIYYSYMEFDLFLRLASRYAAVDLGAIVGHDFHHLDHIPAWRSWEEQPRSNNNVIRTPEDPPPEFAPTGPGWGLAGHDLELEAGTAPALEERDVRWSASLWPELIRSSVAGLALTVADEVRREIGRRGMVRGIAYSLVVSSGLRPRLGRLRRRSAIDEDP